MVNVIDFLTDVAEAIARSGRFLKLPLGTREFDPEDESPFVPFREDPILGPVIQVLEDITGQRIEVLPRLTVQRALRDPVVRETISSLPESAFSDSMAQRDPETGQFVSSDSGVQQAGAGGSPVHQNFYHYEDDIIQQDIHASFTLDLSAGNGSDLPAQDEVIGGAYIEQPPLGGAGASVLEEDKVAELIAIHRSGCSMHVQQRDAQGTTPGSAFAEFELLQQADRGSEVDVSSGDISTNHANLGPASTADVIDDVAYTYVDDQAALDFVILAATQGWKDGGAASGASGAVSTAQPFTLNFRHNFGRGPTVTRNGRDRMVVTYTVEWDEIDNLPIHLDGHWRLWWDMYEFDLPAPRDVPGVGSD